MKKVLISLFFLFCLFMLILNNEDESQFVMGEITQNNSYYYELDFNNDILTFRNFKLKLGIFTSYNYYIKKVFIKYPGNIKDRLLDKKYFSFDNSNFNFGIERLKNEYIVMLKDNNLYDELDKDINDVVIEKVHLYCTRDALTKFMYKFPNVRVNELR